MTRPCRGQGGKKGVASGDKPGGEKTGRSTEKWKFAFHKNTEHEFTKDFAPRTDRHVYLNKFKVAVVEQTSNLDWTEVVENAAKEIPDAVPKAQVKSKGMVAFSFELDHNWRVTCAVAEDDATVLVAHVFRSRHMDNAPEHRKYTCVIGARNTDDQGQKIDPPRYRIQDPDPE